MDKKLTPTEKPKVTKPAVPEIKKGIELKLEGEYLVIKVPKKDLTKKLLAELL